MDVEVCLSLEPFEGGIPTIVGIIQASQEFRVTGVLYRNPVRYSSSCMYDHVLGDVFYETRKKVL